MIDEQRETTLPIVRQESWHFFRNLALLKVTRQQRETHQKQEQVREDHPFVLHVQPEAREANPELKSGEGELVCGDGRKPSQSDCKCLLMEERNAEQGQRKKDEVHGDSEDQYRLDHVSPLRSKILCRPAMILLTSSLVR